MTSHRRIQLRHIMQLAWGLFRAEQGGPNPRTFADALAGAWRFRKRTAEWDALRWLDEPQPRHIRFRSTSSSPIRQSLTGQRFATGRAASASYAVSRFGR